MTNSPNLDNRRTKAIIKPAPDEHIDPIEPPAPSPAEPAAKTPPAPEERKAASTRAETALRALNLQVSEEVAQTIDFAKFKTKLSKRAIVEQAVLAHWASYKPE